MLIPILIIGIGLVGSTYWINEVYQEVFDWEREQIALDNGVIKLGQGHRDLFHWLVKSNQRLAALEKIHHPLHACARLPATTAVCVEKDKLIEVIIRRLHQSIGVVARRRWRFNRNRAKLQILHMKGKVCREESPHTLPIQAQRCPLCDLPQSWELATPAPLYFKYTSCRSYQNPIFSAIQLRGKHLNDENWNYAFSK